MALDGIPPQNASPTILPDAPRRAPPLPTAKHEEIVAYAKAELRSRDVASFSSHAQELQELSANRQRETVGTAQLGATSKQGSAVNVTVNTAPTVDPLPTPQGDSLTPTTAAKYSVSLTRQDGNQLNIDFAENIRINEAKNGTTSVYFSDTNKTRTYALDGSMAEAEGNTVAPDADAIIINTASKMVQGGNGDNLIFNFANDVEIQGGSGNDTIILADDISGNTIATGAGDDTVRGRLISNTNINLGDGNNSAEFSGMENSLLTANNGDNSITFTAIGKMRGDKIIRDENGNQRDWRISGSNITLGDGNNTFDMSYIDDNTTVLAGNGNNSIKISSIRENSKLLVGDGTNNLSLYDITNNGIVDIGNGTNTVDIYTVGNNNNFHTGGTYSGDAAQITIGNGNNIVTISETQNNGNVNIGDGNNIISIHSTDDNSKVTIGNGHNAISGYSVEKNSAMNIGNGNNTVQMYSTQDNGSLSMGNGNNSAKIAYLYNNSSVNAGDGNNAIRINTIHNNGQVQVGDGNNDMGIDIMQDAASLKTGDGDNLVKTNTMRGTSSASFGKGNNFAILNARLDDSKFSGNGSLYIFSQFKDDVAEISRQFTELKQQREANGLPTTNFTMALNAYMSGYGNGFAPPPDNTPPEPGAPGININFSWGDQYGHWGSHPVEKYV